MKNFTKAVLLSCFVFGSSAVSASDFTLKIHQEAKAAKSQFCYTDFEIDLDGNWVANSMYSNGQQWNPGRFHSVMTVRSKDGRNIITIPQNHHVKGSHTGPAREKRTSAKGKLPAEIAKIVSKNNVVYSCRIVSDINFENIKKVVEVAKWVLKL